MTSPTSKPINFAKDTNPSRSHSVQFSPPSPKSAPRRPHQDHHSSEGQTNESSADEITPIISHQRNSRRYDGSPPTSDQAGNNDQQPYASRNSSNTSITRKRKKSTQSPNNEVDGTGPISPSSEEGNRSANGFMGWLRDTADKYGSVELDNKGSVARDHLALERTFLAWLRTSLAFASIGIAVTQLFRLNTSIKRPDDLQPADPSSPHRLRHVGKPLGATFLAIAIVVLLVGGRRYFESQYWIIRGKFPASRGSIFLITFIAAALIVASLVVVCVIDPSVFERK